jgi:uncharacterized protein (UPF0297 family)
MDNDSLESKTMDAAGDLKDDAYDIVTQALGWMQRTATANVPMYEDQLNTIRRALAVKKAIGDSIKECPFCESKNIKEEVTTCEVIRHFEMDELKKTYSVVATICQDCKQGWLDYRAEEAELQALVKLLHDEVHRLRGVVKAQAANGVGGPT